MTGPLRRGQAPWLRPAQVAVWRGGQWVDSPAALTALDKRILYPPARWPEELDDRRATAGRLQLTFTDSFPVISGDGALHLRVRVSGGRVPTCAVHGPVRLLGHNAAEPIPRGWHPATLHVGPLTTPMTVVLDLDAPVSRALLARTATL